MSEGSWTPPPEGSMCWIEIPVTNVDAGKKFYSSLFPAWEWREPTGDHKAEDIAMISFPGKSGIGGGIFKVPADCKTSEQKSGIGVTVYHMVKSIDETVKKVEKLGGSVAGEKTRESANGEYIYVKDPEGNRFGLYQWTP